MYGCSFYYGKKQGYKVSESIGWRDKIFLTLDALPSLLLIVVVIGGIVSGVFTATEGCSCGCTLFDRIIAYL